MEKGRLEAFTDGVIAIIITIMVLEIKTPAGMESKLARAVGKDPKSKFSLGVYLAAIPISFFSRWVAIGFYILNAALWFLPDRRIESLVK